jgi:uncharacterized membrane protein
MPILITYLEFSQKIESDEYDILTCDNILFLALSIFRHLTHGSVLVVILGVFDSFLFLGPYPYF